MCAVLVWVRAWTKRVPGLRQNGAPAGQNPGNPCLYQHVILYKRRHGNTASRVFEHVHVGVPIIQVVEFVMRGCNQSEDTVVVFLVGCSRSMPRCPSTNRLNALQYPTWAVLKFLDRSEPHR